MLLLGCNGLHAAAQTSIVAPVRINEDLHSKRPATVSDVIGMTNIADTSRLGGFTDEGSSVVDFSPDGSKFAFVTQKGNLKSDTVEFSLLLFKTADVFGSPHPEVAATLESSSNRPAISHLTWLRDNETIVFVGERPGEIPQLYSVNSATKQIVKLTDQSTGVLTYSINDKGESLVYLARPSSSPERSEMLHRGFPVTSQNWDDLYLGNRREPNRALREVFVKTPQMKSAQRVGGILATPDGGGVSISPNGKYALITAFNPTPPAIWGEYKPGFDTLILTKSCSLKQAHACPLQYLLLDLTNQTIDPLITAPVLRASEGKALFTWTKENSILLVNTFLPLDSADKEERSRRRSSIYAAEVILPERKIIEIAERKVPFHAYEIHSGTLTDQFITQSFVAAFGPGLEFCRDASGWKVTEAASAATRASGGISISLDQNMNTPPKLVANDARTGKKAVLLDLNPQFSELTFGRVETFKWTTHDGYPLEGSLYFPPDYAAGRRYPLIIQTHGYHDNRFWPDGPFTTAFAAQPLANRGFLVLQVPTTNPDANASVIAKTVGFFSTPAEGPYFTAVFESAIDKLDSLGLADTTRVGLTGFSRTVYHVLYALTHSNHHFAAAVAADGVNFGYANCIYYLAKTDSALCERMNGGGPPYGANLMGWEKESPTFRLDKIEAPLLLQAISGPLGEWEILAGLRWLKKPVEMLNFYPEGAHELVRPQERSLSQGSVVDWYCFWLKGEEDPDPAKAEQYTRWRKMKQERDNSSVRAGR